MKNSIEKFVCFLFLGGLQFFNAFAQEDVTKTLPLNDLSAFRSQAGNWQIVGEVTMDRMVDVHHKEEAPASTRKKKKKKRKLKKKKKKEKKKKKKEKEKKGNEIEKEKEKGK